MEVHQRRQKQAMEKKKMLVMNRKIAFFRRRQRHPSYATFRLVQMCQTRAVNCSLRCWRAETLVEELAEVRA